MMTTIHLEADASASAYDVGLFRAIALGELNINLPPHVTLEGAQHLADAISYVLKKPDGFDEKMSEALRKARAI